MSNPNILPSNEAVLAAVIDPDVLTAATHTSGWVSLVDFDAIQAIVLAGSLGSSATLDAKLEQATDSSGSGAKDITGKAITQLTQAGSDDDKQAIINCRSDELDVDNDFTHVRLSITVGTASSNGGGLILGHYARYQPEADASTVDEVVS